MKNEIKSEKLPTSTFRTRFLLSTVGATVQELKSGWAITHTPSHTSSECIRMYPYPSDKWKEVFLIKTCDVLLRGYGCAPKGSLEGRIENATAPPFKHPAI